MSKFHAGDLAFTGDNELIQIRQVFPETQQVLGFLILKQSFIVVPIDQVSNRIESDQTNEFIENVLVISADGQRGEPGKRVRVDDDRQIVSVRLKDGTVIEAPAAQIVVDGSKMLTADVIIHMLRISSTKRELLGKLAQLSKAYRQVVNSDRVWQYMLLQDYNAMYNHYVSAETSELHNIVKVGLDAYTRETYKRGKNYNKRFYEFLQKLKSEKMLDVQESGSKFPGIVGSVSITKYVNAVFQSGEFVYVLFGRTQGLNSGNYLVQMRHSDDIFSILSQAAAPIRTPGKLIHQSSKDPIELVTYDQDGHVRVVPRDSKMIIWYFSETAQKDFIIWDAINEISNYYAVHMTKTAIALSLFRWSGRIFTSFIFSRRDGTLIRRLDDTWVIRQISARIFHSVNLNDTYLQPFSRNIEEWRPGRDYSKYEGVLFQKELYVHLVFGGSEDVFNPAEWQKVTHDQKTAITIATMISRGRWHAPWREIEATADRIVTSEPILDAWTSLPKFFPNFNERMDEVIVTDGFYGYGVETGWESQISTERKISGSPLYNRDLRFPGYTNALASRAGRLSRQLFRGAAHPIFDSNGILHAFLESRRGKPFLTKLVVDPVNTQRETNLVSCHVCDGDSQSACSRCKATICGKECFNAHVLQCLK